MGTLLKIALRNTIRHGRRTLITAVIMMAGISVFIFFDSLLGGLSRTTIDTMEDYASSSLKIRSPAYVEDIEATPLDKPVVNPDKAIAALAAEGLPAASRIRFVARLSNDAEEVPILADAVDPVADAKVFKIPRTISAGSWLDAARGKSVVLGARLADELNLRVGDRVLVSAQTVNDMTNADEYTVAGLVATPEPEVNQSGLFMSLADARALLDAPGLVTEVNAALPRAATFTQALSAGDSVAARLRQALPGLRVDPISALAKVYLAEIDAHSRYSLIVIVVVLLIAAVGIINTIFMSVYSRIREIGVLRAYGMVPADIAWLFTFEGLSLGVFGSLLGVILGIFLDFLIVTKGISFAAFTQTITWFAGVVRGEWNPRTILIGFGFGVLVSLVASLIPARRAARLEPTDAFRFQ